MRSASESGAVNATIISTGDELIRGRIADTNAAFLAARLNAAGFAVLRAITLGDDPAALAAELRRSAADSALILVTGGLGPTGDDRTRGAVAEAVGRPLVECAESLRALTERLRGYGRAVDERQRAQALFPEGSTVLPNGRGTARGFACRMADAWIVVMPGVPGEMRAMFLESVTPFLERELAPGVAVRSETVHLFPIAEPDADARVADLMAPEANPLVGITVSGGIVTISLRASAPSARQAEDVLARHLEIVQERFGGLVFGRGPVTLARALSVELERTGATVAVAESLTGGLVGSLLVVVPGISRFFLADVVAYSNESKKTLLGVPRELIERHGAVSAQVAGAMARGVCRVSGARLGLATTGIAGPDGGSAAKPVGLVYVAVQWDGRRAVARFQLPGDRARVRDRAAKHALNMGRLALLRGVDDPALAPGAVEVQTAGCEDIP